MWDFFKQAAQKGVAVGKEYYEQHDFVERLLAMRTVDAARGALQAKVAGMNPHARGLLRFAIDTLAKQEQRPDRKHMLELLARELGPQAAAPAPAASAPASPAAFIASPATPAIPATPAGRPAPIPLRQSGERGRCEDCRHFRPARPISRLLEAEFGRFDAAVSQAIGDVRRVEQSLQEQEAKNKVQIISGGLLNDRWHGRPVMSSYCGLQEASGVYLFHEVKNPGPPWSCNDFQPTNGLRQSCATCVHCTKATGDKFDRDMIAHYGSMSGMANISTGPARPSSAVADSGLQSHLGATGPRKAQEITAVFNARGVLGSKPFYLDYCRAYSNEPDRSFVVCLTKNTHGVCPMWTRPCSQCGIVGRPGKLFCPNCGASLADAPGAPAEAIVTLPTSPLGDPIAECGGYTFLLQRGKLCVWKPNAAPDQQIRYDVALLPMNEWFGLQEGQGARLPVSVINNRGSFQAKVAAQPEAGLRALTPVGGASGTQRHVIELFLNYDHPTNNYRVFRLDPRKEVLCVRDPISMEIFDINLARLRNGQSITLRDPHNRELPIKIGREQDKFVLEWL